MQNDKLRDFLKFFRSHLAWFILSAGFFAVILLSGLFLSTKYVVDTASDESSVAAPSSSPENLKLADLLKTPSTTAKLADSATPTVTSTPVPSATAKPLATLAPSVTPAPTTQVTQPISHESTDVHIVKAGDTLWAVAEQHYQDGSLFSHISRENDLSNPSLIYVGQTLKISPLDDSQHREKITDEAWSQDNTTYVKYTIAQGDSLWKIAEEQLGDPYRWPELYQINKAVIGNNPDLIYPNVELRIPDDSKPVSQSPQPFNWTSSLLQ